MIEQAHTRTHLVLTHDRCEMDRLLSLRESIHGTGSRCDAEDCVEFSDLSVRLARQRPDAVLIYVGNSPLSIAAPLIFEATNAGVPALLIGPKSNAENIVIAFRLGARDYLDETNLVDGLLGSLDSLSQRGDLGFIPGHCVSVLSAHPGAGVTTIAMGLAFRFAKLLSVSTALAELNNAVPELALLLDQFPTRTLTDVLERAEIVDVTMLRQAMVNHPDGVDLLMQARDIRQPIPPGTIAIRRLLTLLRAMYRTTVFDLGHEYTPSVVEAVRLSNITLVVLRADVPSLHLTRLLLKDLAENEVSADKLMLVVNRSGQGGELDSAALTQGTGMKIESWIPDAPKLVNMARNRGVTLDTVAEGSRLSRELKSLATKLAAKFK